MSEELEVLSRSVGSAGAMVSAGQTMMQMKDKYTTAIRCQVPRQQTELIKVAASEAELMAELCYYSWTVEGKAGRSLVEGLSIDAAMMMVRNWGNCSVDCDLVGETDTHYILKGYFLDYQTGFTCTRIFKQRKRTGSGGRMDEDRAADIALQVGVSKAVRNATLNGLPAWLKREVMDRAKLGAANRLSSGGVHKAIERVEQAFAAHGVKMEQLERKLGASHKTWTSDHLATLRGIWTSLDNGDTTVANEFDQAEEAKQGLADQLPEQPKAEEPKATSKEAPKTEEQPKRGRKPKAEQSKEEPKAEPEKAEQPKEEPKPEEPKEQPKSEPAPKEEQQAEDDKKAELPRPTLKAIEMFGGLKVTRAMLEQRTGKSAADWDRQTMSDLRGLYDSLKSGETTVDKAFGAPATDDWGEEGSK